VNGTEQQATFPNDVEALQRFAVSFEESRVLLTACELDVFTAIGDEGLAAEEVARRIGANGGGTEQLLNALCGLGLLLKSEGHSSNSPVAGRHLVRGKPDHVSMLYLAHTWEKWSLLTDSIRTGLPVVVSPFRDPVRVWVGALATRFGRIAKRLWLVARRSDVWLRASIDYMRDHARTRAAAVVEILDLSGVGHVLDLGGGPAEYALAFARAKDDLRVTIFDHSTVVPTTRKIVSEAGLTERIDAVGGDLRKDDLGDGYDLVLLSETSHAMSGPDNEALVRRAYGALNPGGRLVIQDFILNDERTGPRFATLFSLNMMMGKEGADTYSESEVRGWMSSAGFSEFEQIDTSFGTTLIIGTKR